MSSIERMLARIQHALGIYLSAGAIVRAIQEDRRPEPDDQRRLGIGPRAFLGIGHG